jgi:SulP family sulfate permease
MTTAIAAFPLSIGFAIIAGVPPEVMILASIYSAFFNAIFASSKYGVGGPNTAAALITGAAIAPFAPAEGVLYMGYLFSLTIMVGVVQIILCLIMTRIDIMDYVSNTVIDGLTAGIGAIFILTAINMASGLSPDGQNQWAVFNGLTSIALIVDGHANSYSVIISLVTIITGIICWRIRKLKCYAIIIGIISGFLASIFLLNSTQTRVELVGWIDLPLFATSQPDFRQVSWPILFQLISPAMAIAFVGALQTLSIAKAIRNPYDEYNPVREIFSQGMQHLFLGFFNGAPVSNSFNKSAFLKEMHGGKLALIASAIFTAIFVSEFGAVIAAIPMPALGGCLILVGMSMMNPRKYQTHVQSGTLRMTVFLASSFSVVLLNIQTAIFVGAILSIGLHFIRFSNPEVRITTKDKRLIIRITGSFFFVSGAKLYTRVYHQLVLDQKKRYERIDVDLKGSHIYSSEKMESDWLHQLLNLSDKVWLICLERQRGDMDKLLRSMQLPKGCHVIYDDYF